MIKKILFWIPGQVLAVAGWWKAASREQRLKAVGMLMFVVWYLQFVKSNLDMLSDPRNLKFWVAWGPILVWQNYAFTFVSRARSSASIKRHAIAALQSNGVWFLQFLFAVAAFNRIIKGEYGWKMSALAVLYYTAFTMSGSLYAHYRALKTEHGLTAVGANKKYAQIPVEEWTAVKSYIDARSSSKQA